MMGKMSRVDGASSTIDLAGGDMRLERVRDYIEDSVH
jgi:hypothetical protein